MKSIKILIPLLLALVILVPSACAQENTLILVSDNEADLLLATTIADELEYSLAVTEWGKFEQEVLDGILDAAPDNVVIIGGILAVPEEYKLRLEEQNMLVERVQGRTRQQTSVKAYEKYRNRITRRILVSDGNEPIVTNDTVPIYYYDNETEIEEIINDTNDTEVTNQTRVQSMGISAQVLQINEQMRIQVQAIKEEAKNSTEDGKVALGPQISAIRSEHGKLVREIARQHGRTQTGTEDNETEDNETEENDTEVNQSDNTSIVSTII